MKKINAQGYIDGEVVVGIFVALLVLMFVGACIATSMYRSMHHSQVTFTVNKSERIIENGSSQYMIYTDNGVYKDVDSMLNGKYNSADVYNQLKVGHKYHCDVTGYRLQYTSDFQNIISCEEVK